MIFDEEYFRQPVFPVRLLKGFAHLFDALPISGEIFSCLEVPSQIESVALSHVWVATTLVPTREMVKPVVQVYNANEGRELLSSWHR